MGEKRLPKKAKWYEFIEVQEISTTKIGLIPRPKWTDEEKTTAQQLCTRLEHRLMTPTLRVTTGFLSKEPRTYEICWDLILYNARDYEKETLEIQLQSKDVDAPDFRQVQQRIEEILYMRATQEVQFHNGEDNNAELTKGAMLWVPLHTRRRITQEEFGDLMLEIEREYVTGRINNRKVTFVNIPARHAEEMGLREYKITGYKTI